jgi:transposase
MEMASLPATAASPLCLPLQQELIEARCSAAYYKSLHERAKEKIAELEQRLEESEAERKKLDRQLFGRSSEKSTSREGGEGSSPGAKRNSRRRGQQPGRPGPRRRDTSHLPSEEEHHDLAPEECRCGRCGLPFREFPGTEDSETIEIEVSAYKRIYRRHRYQPTCECEHLPGIITAPGRPKLIPKGIYGISLWEEILLDKFAFMRPTNRLLDDLRSHGIDLAMGTVTGGLKRLKPLFDPIREEAIRRILEEIRWHADETNWRVFVSVEGKVGCNWKLWVFQSAPTVVFVLDPTRKAKVPQTFFGDVEKDGQLRILSADRFSSYKAMVQVKDGRILIAFCWVHVRRDFLGVAQDWPGHRDWGLGWARAIGELFHLNSLRLDAPSEEFAECDQDLRDAVEQMKKQRDEELDDEQLHPVRRKVLKSLRNHWDGLRLFIDHPEVPMDNNIAERTLRDPVCGRKQFFGSYAIWAGHLAATMFSVFATLELWAINPRLWLRAYLGACAQAGGKAPPDAARWLPWNLPLSERAAMAEVDTS